MHDLPANWRALCAIVFLLGLKHGFDAGHLATIDGWSDGKELVFGAVVVAVIAGGYGRARHLARRCAPAAAAPP